MTDAELNSTRPIAEEILAGDTLIPSAAARLVPAHRGSGHTSASTILRWITVGTGTPDGRTVRLEAVRLGGRWLTSRAALGRYMANLTPVTSDEATSGHGKVGVVIPDVVAELEEENVRLRAENSALRKQVEGHWERIAHQSELLSRKAEKAT